MLYHLLSTPNLKRHAPKKNRACRPNSRNFNTRVKANIKETDDAFEIHLATPGIKKEDVAINFANHELTISASGESKAEEFLRKEFDYSSFKKVFTLPQIADHEKISASMDNGILSISIPKKEELKPKTISIK